MKATSLPGLKPERRLELGTTGYVVCLAFSLTVAVLAQGWRVVLACGFALTLAAVFCPGGLRPLAARRLWILLGVLVVLMTFLFGPGDWEIGGWTLSSQGLAISAQMALRAVAIVVAVAGFASTVSVSELAGLTERFGLKGLGFACGVALNMLPTVQETATNAYHAIRLRGGFRRKRFRAFRLLLVAVIVNSLRQADDIVTAAEARAFSARRIRPVRIERRRRDLALAGALLVIALLIVVPA